MGRHSLRCLVDDDQILPCLWVGAVEARRELEIVRRREAVETQVIAALDVRLALGDLLRRDRRGGEELGQVGASEESSPRACSS